MCTKARKATPGVTNKREELPMFLRKLMFAATSAIALVLDGRQALAEVHHPGGQHADECVDEVAAVDEMGLRRRVVVVEIGRAHV